MRKLLIMINAIAVSFIVLAETWTDPATGLVWTYHVRNKTAGVGNADYPAVTAVPKTTKGDISIPLALGGYLVTRIGSSAFSECQYLTSVTIPSCVTTIEYGAFAHCWGLTNMVIPSSVTSIGMAAFANCISLVDITIPSGVKQISANAFGSCTKLKNVTIMKGVAEIQDYAFANCSKLTSITIPSSVKTISAYAFGSSPISIVYVDTGDSSRVKSLFGWSSTVKFVEAEEIENWVKMDLAPKYKIEGETVEQYCQRFENKFGSYYPAAALKETGKMDGDGANMYVMDDYVSGSDPLDVESQFIATITMVEENPQVQWDPVLVEAEAAKRVYTKYGKVKLSDEWEVVAEGNESNYNFFKVSVKMK